MKFPFDPKFDRLWSMAVPRMFALYVLHIYRRAMRRVREFGLRCVLGHAGDGLHVWGRVRIDYPSRVYLGNNCALNEGVLILARDDICIGNGVILSANVMVISASLDYAHSPPPYGRASAPVLIGDYVWVGAGAKILPGVRIGAGAVIGAGAIVTRDVPENVVAVGAPARVIRQLPPYAERAEQVILAA